MTLKFLVYYHFDPRNSPSILQYKDKHNFTSTFKEKKKKNKFVQY